MSQPTPIAIVREDGSVEDLGRWLGLSACSVPEHVAPLFHTLVSLIQAHPQVDPAFRAMWLRYVGA